MIRLAAPEHQAGDCHGFAYLWLLRFPRVLIAEDDDELRASLASLFLEDGFEVFAVGNGDDLLAAFEWADADGGGRFDMVVTDLRMPGDSPLKTLRTLRARGIDTPLIVMTAYDEPGLREEVTALGSAELVGKPFNPIDLENAVVVQIGRAGTPSP